MTNEELMIELQNILFTTLHSDKHCYINKKLVVNVIDALHDAVMKELQQKAIDVKSAELADIQKGVIAYEVLQRLLSEGYAEDVLVHFGDIIKAFKEANKNRG